MARGQVVVGGHVAAGVEVEAELGHHPVALGPEKPMARSTSSQGRSNSVPGTGSTTGRPSTTVISTSWPRRALTPPMPSSTKAVVVTA